MRTISLDGMKQLFKQEAEDIFLCIIDIPLETDPLRFVNDIVELEYNGNTYLPLYFKITLPPDVKDKQPTAKIVLDNINRELINILRSVEVPLDLIVNIIRKQADGTIVKEIGPFNFKFTNITYDATSLEAELGFEYDFVNETATADYFTPHLFPGLF